MDKSRPINDRLELAALFLKGLLVFCIAIPLLVFFDSSLRKPVEESSTAALFRSLGLTTFTLTPSGREAGHPEWMERRVDWRISPFFPIPDPDPAKLIFRGTEYKPPRTAPE